MTIDDYRSDTVQVDELRNLLTNPALQQALLVIHDAKTIDDAEGSELESVRLLSRLAGRAEVVRELYLLATHLPAPTKPQIPTFGVTETPPEGWSPESL